MWEYTETGDDPEFQVRTLARQGGPKREIIYRAETQAGATAYVLACWTNTNIEPSAPAEPLEALLDKCEGWGASFEFGLNYSEAHDGNFFAKLRDEVGHVVDVVYHDDLTDLTRAAAGLLGEWKVGRTHAA
jgi:hypothetical protein